MVIFSKKSFSYEFDIFFLLFYHSSYHFINSFSFIKDIPKVKIHFKSNIRSINCFHSIFSNFIFQIFKFFQIIFWTFWLLLCFIFGTCNLIFFYLIFKPSYTTEMLKCFTINTETMSIEERTHF